MAIHTVGNHVWGTIGDAKPPVDSLVKPAPPIFYFGGTTVRTTDRIRKGLFYKDGRGKVCRVNDYFEGIVVLDWLETGKQSQCSEQRFCRRFYLYGNGHSV